MNLEQTKNEETRTETSRGMRVTKDE